MPTNTENTEHVLTWDEFEQVDMRVGTITRVEDFPEARKPAYKLWVDLGEEIGEKKSSAQITALYTKEELLGKQVICVTNFPPRQIGPVRSEVLLTGLYKTSSEIVLAVPDKPVPNGSKLG